MGRAPRLHQKKMFMSSRLNFQPQTFTFTQSGSFVLPRGCQKLTVTVIGGGGGQGGGVIINKVVFGGGGGGAGGKGISVFTGADISAMKGQTLAIVVGVGGSKGGSFSAGTPGGESSFAKGTAQQVIGYGGAGGQENQGGGAGGSFLAQTGTNGANGGNGGIVSTGASAPGQVIEGVGTFGGGYAAGVVYIVAE